MVTHVVSQLRILSKLYARNVQHERPVLYRINKKKKKNKVETHLTPTSDHVYTYFNFNFNFSFNYNLHVRAFIANNETRTTTAFPISIIERNQTNATFL